MKKKQKIKTWDFRRSKWAHFLKLKNSPVRALTGSNSSSFLTVPKLRDLPFCPDASGRLPNPMVGEISGGTIMDIGIWNFSIGISKVFYVPSYTFDFMTFVLFSRKAAIPMARDAKIHDEPCF
jgi:hypothetical protein